MTSKKKLRAKIAVLKYQRKQLIKSLWERTEYHTRHEHIPYEHKTVTRPATPPKAAEVLDEAEELVNIDLPKVYSAPVEAADWQEGMHIGASFFTPRAIMEINADLLLWTDYDYWLGLHGLWSKKKADREQVGSQ